MFERVVEYRTYCLLDTRAELNAHEVTTLHNIKRSLDNAVTIQVYNSSQLLGLLLFLRALHRVCLNKIIIEAMKRGLFAL